MRGTSSIRAADTIAVGDPSTRRGVYNIVDYFRFEHLSKELRGLIKREAEQQIAVIEKEMRALGVTPDEFEDAAPTDDEPKPVTLMIHQAKQRK